MNHFYDFAPDIFEACAKPYVGTYCPICDNTWGSIEQISNHENILTPRGLMHRLCWESTLNAIPVGTRVRHPWHSGGGYTYGVVTGYHWFKDGDFGYKVMVDQAPAIFHDMKPVHANMMYRKRYVLDIVSKDNNQRHNLTWWLQMEYLFFINNQGDWYGQSESLYVSTEIEVAE